MPRPLSHQDIQKFREELVTQATRQFAEKGVQGVTMRSLAKAQGCSPMTPYRYFESKDEVFQAARTAAFARLGERVAAVAQLHDDPEQRIRALSREYVRFALDEPHAYRIMFQLDQNQPGEMEEILQQKELQSGWQVLCDAMAAGVDAGILVGDPTLLAHLAWVACHGCITLHLSEKLRLGFDLEALLEPMLDHFFRGSSARAPARETRS